MTTFKRGEVVLLAFPFTDLSTPRRRPAVVLSTEARQAHRTDLIVAPITSNTVSSQPEDCVLNDWSMAGLMHPSVVKAVLATVDQTRVIRSLGALSAADLKRVEQMLTTALGLQENVPKQG
jgi:mRNA interferase MazF